MMSWTEQQLKVEIKGFIQKIRDIELRNQVDFIDFKNILNFEKMILRLKLQNPFWRKMKWSAI